MRVRTNSSIRLLIISYLFLLIASAHAQATKEIKYQLTLDTDNDAIGPTTNYDRYYTYGIGLGFKFKPKKLLGLKSLFQTKEGYYFDVRIRIEGYTADAEELEASNIQQNNFQFKRPFAGLLFATFDVNYLFKRSFFKPQILIGVMGPSSGAGRVQEWFHESITDGAGLDGWRFQLPNQLLLNFKADYYYDITPKNKWFDLYMSSEVRFGNLYIDAASELGFRIGNYREISKSTAFGNRLLENSKKSELFFLSSIKGKINAFNATIQGNIFRPNSSYANDKINTFSVIFKQGLYFSSRRFSVSYQHFFTFGEVVYNELHFYARTSFSYRF